MRLIIGLGNPGKKYTTTRHNIGFLVVNAFARELGVKFKLDKKIKAEVAEAANGMIIAKPQTYMNNSGQAVNLLTTHYSLLTTDLLIVQDEADLPFGQIRISKNSGSAGHNGIKSIIQTLGTQNFTRLRIGIDARGRRSERDTEDYVLENFTAAELAIIKQQVIPAAVEQIKTIINTPSSSPL